ncbi:Neuronal acetylcholine receptor subunit alpha-3 [Schistosoma haematobium]|uniref:Neuronal acetylcholine receptor subunit alpha-3 n=1 Tax=Schistosoma haematobium TaxID=6185 RepID=A0A922LEJ4_SCHHA|nr:Neuronal acetylcholine receptor subunit alpha-3 [Schistosoma haematobium]KAH9579664.1 Neuronal acetylcholine receptor subunit alpha-3 [Schistosoma haematobium]
MNTELSNEKFQDIVLSGLYEKRLLKYLFDSSRPDAHNPIERPSANDTETLNVSVKFFLNQVMDVDEKNQVLTTIIWMDLIWNDYHFLWNPKEFGNITTLNLPYTAVWRPDILLYNCADEKFDRTFPTNTIIKHDGTVQWMPPGLFKSTCNIDILWFPFDEQSCILKFGSWTYYGDQINFQLQCINASQPDCTQVGTVDLSEYSRNGEFHLSGSSVRRYAQRYECCDYDFVDVKIAITLQRRALYYVFNLIVPCLLISGMALMVFMLPPDAGEKISLGVTILLSLTMFLQLVADKLPQTSEAIPLIGIYFSCTMFMCSLSIVFTVLVLNYHHRSADCIAVPAWIRNIVNTYLAKLMCMEPPKRSQIIEVEDISSSISDNFMENYPNTKKSQNETLIKGGARGEQQQQEGGGEEEEDDEEGHIGAKTFVGWNYDTTNMMNSNINPVYMKNIYSLIPLYNTVNERTPKNAIANVIDLDDDFRATARFGNTTTTTTNTTHTTTTTHTNNSNIFINMHEKQTILNNNTKLKMNTDLLSSVTVTNQSLTVQSPYRLYNSVGNFNSKSVPLTPISTLEHVQNVFPDEFSDLSKNGVSFDRQIEPDPLSISIDLLNLYKPDLEIIINELHFITKIT